jgi:small subunit ribosomal protein S16
MVTIKLKRIGRRKQPFYHIIAIEKLAYIKGKYIEKLGYYNPVKEDIETKINIEKINNWIQKGAVISQKVKSIMKKFEKNNKGKK